MPVSRAGMQKIAAKHGVGVSAVQRIKAKCHVEDAYTPPKGIIEGKETNADRNREMV